MVLTRWCFIFHQRLERNYFFIYITTTIVLLVCSIKQLLATTNQTPLPPNHNLEKLNLLIQCWFSILTSSLINVKSTQYTMEVNGLRKLLIRIHQSLSDLIVEKKSIVCDYNASNISILILLYSFMFSSRPHKQVIYSQYYQILGLTNPNSQG